MSNPKSPLPFPADEIRSHAEQLSSELGAEISRLLLFFRGHQKNTMVLDSIALRILSIHMTLHHLSWDSTICEELFADPKKSPATPVTTTEPPTPIPPFPSEPPSTTNLHLRAALDAESSNPARPPTPTP